MKKMTKKMTKKILDYIAFKISNSLEDKFNSQDKLIKQINIEATRRTAKYILDNCSKASVFTSKELLYNFIVKEGLIKNQYLEFGVWEATSLNFFSSKFPNLKFYGFDSFEGLPEHWRPGFEMGSFSLNGDLPKVNKNVTLVKGWFKDSLPNFIDEVQIEPNVFLHIDCDLYSSTNEIFNILGKKINGTFYILFDEYFNYPFWEQHEFRAFQEFISEFGYNYEYVANNLDHEQVLIKVNL